MSTNSDSGSGRAPTGPSARPSIHRHRGLNPIEMVRYGVDASPRTEPVTPPGEDGSRDEVDNAMSKFRKSPLKNISARRHSSEKLRREDCSTDEDGSQENARFANSLPARLPHHMYYREDNLHEPALERSFHDLSNRSEFSPNTSNRSSNSPGSYQDDYIPESFKNSRQRTSPVGSPVSARNYFSPSNTPSYIPERTAQNKRTPHENSGSMGGTAITLIIVSIAFAIILYYNYGNMIYGFWQGNATANKNYSYNREEFSNDLIRLGKTYKITDDSILRLETGLVTISERSDTGSFIFIYNSNAFNFDAAEFNKFINEVSSKAAKYLRNDSTSVRHAVIDGSKLDMKTHSELINRYRAEVNEAGVMLVKGIEEIPSSLAMAFHYYCDEYDPVAKKSAILFTLDMAKCNGVSETPLTHAGIEKCLTNKWSGLPSDNIAPLLARVVDVLVDVTRS